MVLDTLDAEREAPPGTSADLIEFVDDRPGHDYRYAMDTARIRSELGWSPVTGLEVGLRTTVRWYLENLDWLKAVESEEHRSFQDRWYGGRSVNGKD
jgi:dTDP-glucose 4,6-dehydratase